MSERRQVTIEEFRALQCNRCGQCCEGFTIPSPLCLAVDGTLDRLAGAKSAEVNDHNRAILLWYAELEPQETPEWLRGDPANMVARCPRFERDADGLGVCTIYDRRPSTCSNFPSEPFQNAATGEYVVRIDPRLGFDRCVFTAVDIIPGAPWFTEEELAKYSDGGRKSEDDGLSA